MRSRWPAGRGWAVRALPGPGRRLPRRCPRGRSARRRRGPARGLPAGGGLCGPWKLLPAHGTAVLSAATGSGAVSRGLVPPRRRPLRWTTLGTVSSPAAALPSPSDSVRTAPRKRQTRRVLILTGTLAGALLLSGCAGAAVTLDPAPDAADPACAPAMVAMPTQLTGLDQRETTAQATTAWGDPAAIVLKCGVHVQEPVADPCVSVNGVDWILAREDDQADPASAASDSPTRATSGSPSPAASSASAGERSEDPTGTWTATTFGRTPAIRVTFDASKVPSSSLLTELDSAVSQIPQTKRCQSVQDLQYHR
ncbi:DUF3515 family protein [Rothia kristinae]|uniref:DUF3515 family protein n=1 Tax=Rothia kristinae TaxID=37923 RepID=A0A7T3CG87_9MICC|nr:DUF3515 family protein [Rothia kristinae]MCA1169502.1 DUF3515 domain-containing protein [Rothia kristinae]QPT53610.1 DUF3515 family protein [Rothia kristinae]